ncbi:hypothetical protein [Rhodopseudomonas telluris]|uniref:Uncharacterized protein n=1 Tax=Rhodopseudomonas telluris TaxID=644215 RepID=A0ABV6EWN2_9BRAD
MRSLFLCIAIIILPSAAFAAECTTVIAGPNELATIWSNSPSSDWDFLKTARYLYSDDASSETPEGQKSIADLFVEVADANPYSNEFDTVPKTYSYILNSGVWSEAKSRSDTDELRSITSSLYLDGGGKRVPNPAYARYLKLSAAFNDADKNWKENQSAVNEFKWNQARLDLEAVGNGTKYALLETRLKELEVTNAERRKEMLEGLSNSSPTEIFPGALGLRSPLGWSSFSSSPVEKLDNCEPETSLASNTWPILARSNTGVAEYFSGRAGKDGGLSITFEGVQNQVMRPWLDLRLFSMRGWSLPAPLNVPGSISCGDIRTLHSGGACGVLPKITSGILIARNLKLRNLSTALKKWISDNLKQSNEIWIGPLRLSDLSDKSDDGSVRLHAVLSSSTISFAPDYIVLAAERMLIPMSPPTEEPARPRLKGD